MTILKIIKTSLLAVNKPARNQPATHGFDNAIIQTAHIHISASRHQKGDTRILILTSLKPHLYLFD